MRSFPPALVLFAVIACNSGGEVVGDLGPEAAPTDASSDVAEDSGPDADSDTSGPDQFVPFTLSLTVNEIPPAMNGSAPFTNLAGVKEPFRLAVPRHGFTLDLHYRGSDARFETLEVTASVPLGDGAGQIQVGADLAGKLGTAKFGRSSWKVPAELALPEGPVTFTATMSDAKGKTLSAALTVEVHEKTFVLDPFRLEDEWLLVFSQDLYAVSKSTDPTGTIIVTSTVGANGVPDFDEDLRLVGFGSAKMLPAAAKTENAGVVGTNAIIRHWVQRQMLETVRELYGVNADGSLAADSVQIRFSIEGEPGAPKLSDYKLQVLSGVELEKSFSAIGIGGGDTSKPYLGYSKTVDLRNVRNEDNLGPGAGVFTSKAIGTMLELLTSDPAFKAVLSLFFGEVLPELGGKPVGEHTLDAQILAGSFDSTSASAAAASRYKKLTFLVESLGRLAGALTAHEIGHSLGLVASGPPPHGLFGGEKNASFVNGAHTTKVHIDTPGFNVMEAGPGSAPGQPLNPAKFLTTPSFNELNLAYLRGRVLLLP